MMKRLIAATLVGIAVSAAVLFARLALSDQATLATVEPMLDGWAWLRSFGLVLAALLAAGGVPTVLIGAALIYLRRASPITLVLTPAILFLLTLIEVARETHDATVALACLPAMACGGLAMFLWLSKPMPIPQPVEAVFE